MKEIATAAGVNQTTVSRALRGHPSISEKRREEIRTLARNMGYVPDPMMSALAAYRTAHRPVAFHSTIIWLNPSINRTDWKEYRSYRSIFSAAQQHSQKLGFQIEQISLLDNEKQNARLNSMLTARNVAGIVVGPAPSPNTHLTAINWKQFSAIRIGLSMNEPSLHAVTPHHAQSMLKIMDELVNRGYKRPGLFISVHHDQRVNRNFSSTFLGAQGPLFSAKNHIPPNLFSTKRANMKEMVQWIRQNKPDVLIAAGEASLLPTLNAAGFRIPQDIGLAVLSQPEEDDSLSGIIENNEQIGIAAINYLVSMINRQERGIPESTQTLQIAPRWRDNGTLLEAP